MKAIVFERYGSPDALESRDVPKPSPGDDEVLVRVRASSINSWDWEFLNGRPFINRAMFGLTRPRPDKRILGADVAGSVEAVGPNVTRFRPGDEVFGDLWDRWGGFAEYACVHETALETKPETATFEEAAAVPQAGVLAWQGIRKADRVLRGRSVLINGAGGGMGTFAIQLAKVAGAEVTGVDAAHKLGAIRALGADHVIDYARHDFTKIGRRVDLIIDCHNFRSTRDNRRALEPGGTYAMIGGSMLRALQLWALSRYRVFNGGDKKLCLVAEGPNEGLTDLRVLIDAGKLRPVIDRVYPLRDIQDAMRRFAENRHVGKIVVSIP